MMPRLPVSLIALLAAATTLVAGPLDQEIAREISATDLGNASIAVHAIDLQTGADIASYRADADMIPASNMKLITSGAALQVLGTEFVFRTEFAVLPSDAGATLVVTGSGDPALGDPVLLERPEVGLDLNGLLTQLGDVLGQHAEDGFREIVIDDRIFDREFVHPSWPEDQLNRWYCAEVAGLNFRRNVATIFAEPTSDGGSPITNIVPDAPWIALTNRARTDRRGNNTAWVARPQPNDNLTLFGKVRTRLEIDVAIHDPSMFGGRAIARAFESQGIPFTSGPAHSTVRRAEPGESFNDAHTLAVVTTPIQDVLNRVNQDSHNLYAECLIKRLGHEVSGEPGSWGNGASVVRMVISDALGPEFASVTSVADGSGMSRDNRVRPSMLTAWMRWISRDEDRWAMFQQSLATPGEGTLRSRFRGEDALSSDLAAKSGYLSGVYALSGVMTNPDTGRQIAFSILLNDVPSGRQARNAKPLHAAILKELDAYLTPNTRAVNLGG